MKQRLVGALVLLAAGLILVPVLLDFEADERTVSRTLPVPPPPHVTITEPQPTVATGRGSVSRKPGWTEVPEISPSGTGPSAPTAPQGAPAKPDSPAETTVTQPLPGTAVQAGSVATQTGGPAPVGDSQQWVVQLGTFSNQASALKLRDRLRGAGLPAFVEQTETPGGAALRVRLGPLGDRAAAEAMQRRVMQAQQLDGVVLRYMKKQE